MSVLAALNAKTLELRKTRDPLAGVFQSVQSVATSLAKERAIKDGVDLSLVKANDDDALRAVQKSIKQVRDTLAQVPTDAKSLRELELLEAMLPRMASEDEIQGEVDVYLPTLHGDRNMKQMGLVMTHLTAVFGTSLDKAKASVLVRAALAS